MSRFLAAALAVARSVVAAPSGLHGSAAPAHPEPFARKGEARERRGLPAIAQTSEVHLPERGGGDVLEAEGQARSGDGPGALDRARLEVRDELAGVEARLPVVVVVQDAGTPVVLRGVHQA